MPFDLFGEIKGGYGLKTFELYNWGVFDNRLIKINCDNESTLLTGKNGSGKTSIVDALTTLLVDGRNRTYNQSSGIEKKKERTEDSYVLGAYGNTDDDGSTKRMELRKKESVVSILNGIFENKYNGKFLSLLQIRYYSKNDTLMRIFAITTQELTIEKIQDELSENNSKIRDNRYKKIIEQNFDTVFYESFEQYRKTFSSYFGFKSEKATKVFSKTVGLKNLDDFTKFIQEDMLEECGVENEFEKMKGHFDELIESHNNILKSKKQIELLEPILKLGKSLREEKAKEEHLRKLNDIVPYWYSKTAIQLNEQELDKINRDLELERNRECEFSTEKKSLQENLDSIKDAINKNATAQRIKEIDYKIENLETKKNVILRDLQNFEEKLNQARITPPKNENDFIEVKNKIEKSSQENEVKKSKLRDDEYDLKKERDSINAEIETTKAELQSLGNRSSNIPEKNIAVRRLVCEGTGLNENDLPFAGELVQVIKDENAWEYAIEKLLHNFALTLLVNEESYKKVTDFVNKNDLKGRLVYFKVNTAEEQFLESKKKISENSVPKKLEIKQNHELTDWIFSYIEKHFDYECAENFNELSKAQRAITKTGLIKNEIRHEKDDRKISGKIEKVLGWDNAQKRKELSNYLDELESEKTEKDNLISRNAETIFEYEKAANVLNSLKEFSDWTEINPEPLVKEIDKLQQEKTELESKDSDIKKLYEQKEKLDGDLKNVEDELKKITGEIAVLENKHKEISDELNKHKETFDVYESIEDLMKNVGEFLPELFEKFPRRCNPKDINQLNESQNSINAELRTEINSSVRTFVGGGANLMKLMSNYKRPQREIVEKFPTWTSECADFGDDFEYLCDYEEKYDEITNDDLQKYESRFKEYLHRSLTMSVTDFQQFIRLRQQDIENAIRELNQSLEPIIYSKDENTIVRLECAPNFDSRISQFKELLNNATPNPSMEAHDDFDEEERFFEKVKSLIDYVEEKAEQKSYVLDIRKWYKFSASEIYKSGENQGNVFKKYDGTASLSGGQKSKLTYTILAASISYQFGINSDEHANNSFRFVMIDEVFSKIDSDNAEYTMNLFKNLNLQFLFVTPDDKINVVEDYVSSLHITGKISENTSAIHYLSIESYKSDRNALQNQGEVELQ